MLADQGSTADADRIGAPRVPTARRAALPLAMLLALLLAAAPAWAESRGERMNAGDKALRGLANILTGVMAFPGEIYQKWNADGPGMGLTAGVAMGASMIVARELLGVFELVSSPAPWPKKDFSPILEPPYTWNYFQD